MAYFIEVHDSFAFHTKVRRLARLLGIRRNEARGLLVTLWLDVADRACDDGSLAGMDALEIAENADWEGDPDALVAALKDPRIRLVDTDAQGNVTRVHDWRRYTTFLRQRKRDAKRKRDARRAAAERALQDDDDDEPVDNPSADSPRTRRGRDTDAAGPRHGRGGAGPTINNLAIEYPRTRRGRDTDAAGPTPRQPEPEPEPYIKNLEASFETPAARDSLRSRGLDADQILDYAHTRLAHWGQPGAKLLPRLLELVPVPECRWLAAVQKTNEKVTKKRGHWPYVLTVLKGMKNGSDTQRSGACGLRKAIDAPEDEFEKLIREQREKAEKRNGF